MNARAGRETHMDAMLADLNEDVRKTSWLTVCALRGGDTKTAKRHARTAVLCNDLACQIAILARRS